MSLNEEKIYIKCASCGNSHQAGGYFGCTGSEKENSIKNAFGVLCLLIISGWVVDVAKTLFFNLSFGTSIMGLLIIPVIYLFGRICIVDESFDFLYGWSRQVKSSTGLSSILRFGLIVTILSAPFFRHMYGRYVEDYISEQIYSSVVVILILITAFFMSAILTSPRSLHRYGIEQVRKKLDELTTAYPGNVPYSTVKKIILENLDYPRYVYFKMTFRNREEGWDIFTLRAI